MSIATEASECIGLFDEVIVENCLQAYENSFDKKMGFVGTETEPYKSYSNITVSLADQRRSQYQAFRKIADDQQAQYFATSQRPDLSITKIS